MVLPPRSRSDNPLPRGPAGPRKGSEHKAHHRRVCLPGWRWRLCRIHPSLQANRTRHSRAQAFGKRRCACPRTSEARNFQGARRRRTLGNHEAQAAGRPRPRQPLSYLPDRRPANRSPVQWPRERDLANRVELPGRRRLGSRSHQRRPGRSPDQADSPARGTRRIPQAWQRHTRKQIDDPGLRSTRHHHRPRRRMAGCKAGRDMATNA